MVVLFYQYYSLTLTLFQTSVLKVAGVYSANVNRENCWTSSVLLEK